jgi:predicted ATPase/class 3 adenylate cyclase
MMFCDLVGSTELSQRLDPEDYQEWLEGYRTLCTGVVTRFEGRVARVVGDGLLIYFGYPLAHEDDAQRSIRAGLGILDEMKSLRKRFQERFAGSLDLRIGIHTGLVVVGDIGAGETMERMGTIGEAPNIAARVQSVAPVNDLVISQATRRLTHELFETEALGPHELKGIAEPIELYRVIGVSARRSRLELAARMGLTPLVGRKPELEVLSRGWQEVVAGKGRVFLIEGEGGIGKSRLVRALVDAIAETPHRSWEGRCSSHYRHSALYPLADLFEHALEFRESDSDAEKLGKLIAKGARHLADPDDVAFLALLLSIPLPAGHANVELLPNVRRQKVLDTILGFLQGVSRISPLLLVVEDLHWVDPSSVELLTLLIERCRGLRIMLILSFRPEFQSPWLPGEHVRHLVLDRLNADETRQMIQRVTAGKALPTAFIHRVTEATDGIPLFVEEVTRMELDSGSLVEVDGSYELKSQASGQTIPATLRDSLLARLDLLNRGKGVAQLAATVGREFSFDLLAAIAPLDKEKLRSALDQLVEAQLLLQRETESTTVYTFKHALIQEVAYDSVLKRTRRQYHRRVAEVLAETSRDFVRNHPEILAHHYTEAGFAEEGIGYWKLAGARATEYSAHIEAEGHLRRGLELVKRIAPEKQQREELELLVALGIPLTATRSYAHEEGEQLYLRTLELSETLGDSKQKFRSLSGLYRYYITSGQLHRALEYGERLLEVAEGSEDSLLMMEAERATGASLYALGRLEESRSHLERGVSLHDPTRDFRQTLEFSNDPGLSCLIWLICPLWLLGWPAKALASVEKALTLAKRHGHAYGIALTLMYYTWAHAYRREWDLAEARADECLEISNAHGFTLFVGAVNVFRGRALVEAGNVGRGITVLEHGLALYRRTGATLTLPFFSYLLAEAYVAADRVDDALAELDAAARMVEAHDERAWEAEIHRLKGELLHKRRESAALVLQQLDTARTVACAQHAKSLELRVAMTRLRLASSADQRAAALAELSGIYAWFTEGFETPDLKEAKALSKTFA